MVVKEQDDFVVLEIRPIIKQIDVVREIEFTAGATTETVLSSELKTGIEASGKAYLAEIKGSIESAVGASFRVEGSIGASQKVNLIMTYRIVTGMKSRTHIAWPRILPKTKASQ
jgi:hypothetical protein